MLKSGAQLTAQVFSFPCAPLVECLAQVPGAQLDEVAEQPNVSCNLVVVFQLSSRVDLLAKNFDPDVAIVKIA